jgi:hypothetical protein
MPTSPKGGRCPFHLGRLLPFEAAFNREPFAGRGRAPTLHRAFFLRAYLLQTHVMLFDARHNAFVAWGGIPAKRGPPIWIRR